MVLSLLVLSGLAAVITIWTYSRRPQGDRDMGTVSAQWLHNYRAETHAND